MCRFLNYALVKFILPVTLCLVTVVINCLTRIFIAKRDLALDLLNNTVKIPRG